MVWECGGGGWYVGEWDGMEVCRDGVGVWGWGVVCGCVGMVWRSVGMVWEYGGGGWYVGV